MDTMPRSRLASMQAWYWSSRCEFISDPQACQEGGRGREPMEKERVGVGELGMAWAFENAKPTLNDTTSSNKVTPSGVSETVPPAEDQVFK